MAQELWLERLTWAEIEQAIKDGFNTVVVIAGSIEQHGPHLPLSTDTTLGYAIGDRVVKKMGKTLLAPVIRPGMSDHHMAFKGTITVSKATFQATVHDYVKSLAHHGFTRIILTYSHGGNAAALAEIAPKLAAEFPQVEILAVDETMDAFTMSTLPLGEKDGIDAHAQGVHAGECETSLFLASDDTQVRKDKLTKGFVGDLGDMSELLKKGLQAVTENGILGDATHANKARGEKYLEAIANYMATHLVQVKPE